MNHIQYSVQQLQEVFGTNVSISNQDVKIKTVLTDSRKLTDIHHALFFALKARRDGHSFINDVYKLGIRNFVISDTKINLSNYADANFYVVDDSLQALQKLTSYHRSKFKIPVIAITGSNGKTIVKEWLYQLLAPDYNIVRSPKSYNSQIGVPVSVWEMSDENTLAIFEAGISTIGEMENLEKVIQPTIGILTNIGEAHAIGFESPEQKLEEKLKLFKDVDLFIYSCSYLDQYTGEIPGKNKFTWCYRSKADLEVFDDEILEEKYHFLRGNFNGTEVQAAIPFTDMASVENAIICWATLLAMGYSSEEVDKRLQKLLPIKMRLELKNGINNCSIIDDSYSLDVSSLAIALDFLKQQNQHVKRTLILSDIPGASPNQYNLYDKVAALLENKSVDYLIGVGEQIQQHAAKFSVQSIFFNTTADLLENLASLKLSNETILLKGARSFEFELISKALTQKVHETVLEINLNALEHNLNHYKSILKPDVKLMVMVKAFSYGSGGFEIANLLEFNNIDYLAVAYADEGVALRKAGITLPIMVLSPDVQSIDAIINNNLEPEIYSKRILQEFLSELVRRGKSGYPIHIKLDTGMHRLGFMENEVSELINLLINTDLVNVKSVFSHLVASDNPIHDDFTKGQIEQFKSLSQEIETKLNCTFMRHLANTSAISRWPDAQFDLVRLGIGLYGVDGTFEKSKSPLQTVTTLKTSITQIKEISPGETIGYNRMGKMPNGGKIATVKIGYADGYSHALGNGVGKMLVKNKFVPVIGKVCMDMTMIDITGLDVAEGDEVIVFNNVITVEEIAKNLNTIPYEILTGISQRVKRVYYYE